jgi:hypothetical protein
VAHKYQTQAAAQHQTEILDKILHLVLLLHLVAAAVVPGPIPNLDNQADQGVAAALVPEQIVHLAVPQHKVQAVVV